MKIIKYLFIAAVALVLIGAGYEESIPTTKVEISDPGYIAIPINNSKPGRDDADEVIFSEDFEDGAEGWTMIDFTVTDTAFHKSDFNQREDDDLLWWCGDTLRQYDGDPVGYDNQWMQWLDTPVLDLSDAGDEVTLTFDTWWLLEAPRLHPPPDPYDGWDGWLVMISRDGGDEFEPLSPESPVYPSVHLSAAERVWDMPDTPGWVFYSTEDEWPDTTAFERPDVEWVDCVFNLSDYRDADIVIRFILFSDNAVAAPHDNVYLQESGVCIDNIVITDGETEFLVNNADDPPIPEDGELIAGCPNEPSGDFWEITDENGHESDHPAHCPIEPNLLNGLISPPIVIPGEGWYTYFDFWVICNTQMANSDTINDLEDYFDVMISTNLLNWTRIIYDYGADDHNDFYEDWGYYGPDVWFQTGDPNGQGYQEWQWKLNLTAWAGETVYLCWRMITDDVMDDPQGSGLWIDDIRVISNEARMVDIGIEWLNLDYPNTVGLRPYGAIVAKNYGMETQSNIRKFFWQLIFLLLIRF